MAEPANVTFAKIVIGTFLSVGGCILASRYEWFEWVFVGTMLAGVAAVFGWAVWTVVRHWWGSRGQA